MKKNGFTPLFFILIIATLGVVGYFVYKNYLPKNPLLDLVGVWQVSPSLASGWNDRYQFYNSGAYAFVPSQVKCDRTTFAEAGTWKLNGTILTLAKKIEMVAVGGKLVPASASCSSKESLSGYTKQTNVLKTPQVYSLS